MIRSATPTEMYNCLLQDWIQSRLVRLTWTHLAHPRE